jgi:hypothetical protein
VLRRGDGPADTLLLADRPELGKGPGALDGGLVDAGRLEYFVRTLIDRELALGLPWLVGGQVGVGLNDVVLDQRVPGPAVDGKVARAGGVVCAGEFDGPTRQELVDVRDLHGLI